MKSIIDWIRDIRFIATLQEKDWWKKDYCFWQVIWLATPASWTKFDHFLNCRRERAFKRLKDGGRK